MSTSNSVTNYGALNTQTTGTPATKKKDALAQADFLKLMTTQLQHQDPLKPMDNSQMVAQMAQLSTVQGLTDLNTTVSGFQQAMSSDQILRASALVGHEVLVPSNKMPLKEEGGVDAMVMAPSAGFVNVEIKDANGTVVSTMSVEAKASGEVPLAWDGKDKDGNRLAAGTYTITASHTDSAGAKTDRETYVQAPVESVTVGTDGLYLNLKDLGVAPIDYVLRVS